MVKQLFPAFRMLLVLTVITGVLYPLLITAVGQVALRNQAEGSIEVVDGQAVGSSLIAQNNTDARYFWARPSAVGYNAAASAASNLGPTNANLLAAVEEREAAFREANGVPEEVAVPNDMLFASGSGLDPHISPASAALQVNRVAAERGLDAGEVQSLVDEYTEAPQLGIFGDSRVNVLRLNLALDALEG